MKWIYALLIMLIALSACSTNTEVKTEAQVGDADDGQEAKDDSGETENIVAETDVIVDIAERDLEDIPSEVVKDTISDDTVFCESGGIYKYDSKDGDVDAIIIGLETYKGKSFCRAESRTTIQSQMGEIDTDTTYYYNIDASEMWVIATTSSEFMPQPQTNEVHIIDGEVVN